MLEFPSLQVRRTRVVCHRVSTWQWQHCHRWVGSARVRAAASMPPGTARNPSHPGRGDMRVPPSKPPHAPPAAAPVFPKSGIRVPPAH